jgi:hypothetical protein
MPRPLEGAYRSLEIMGLHQHIVRLESRNREDAQACVGQRVSDRGEDTDQV